MGKPAPVAYVPGDDPGEDEEKSVHEVYERIAPHFSQTRYKPWPLIESFLRRLPPNAFGLDSGAGNGKYIPVAKSAGAEMVAMDRSMGLLGIAKGHGGDCVRGDLCGRGWRPGVFDFAISIAAIHHLSTPLRRRLAVQALVHPLYLAAQPPYSRFLIYVWAYEQGKNSKRRMGNAASAATILDVATEKHGENGDGEERVQDVLVPWVLQKPGESSKLKSKPKAKGQQSAEVSPVTPCDVAHSPDATATTTTTGQEAEDKAEVYHRYYHLFAAGELRSLVEEAASEEGFGFVETTDDGGAGPKHAAERPIGKRKWLRIVGEGWEADNWWLEAEVGVS